MMLSHPNVILHCLFVYLTAAQKNHELEQIQILFRHGDQVPGFTDIYGNDPYLSLYQEVGFGQITKTGMQRMYKVGQILKTYYDYFIDEYQYYEVHAYSTDRDITKVSLQLVLAGLYPQTPQKSWYKDMKWLPIPTHYDEDKNNFLSIGFFGRCQKKFSKLYQQALNTPEMVAQYRRYEAIGTYLSNKTGILPKLSSLLHLHNNIHAIRSMGLDFPSWCSQKIFEDLQAITKIVYNASEHTTSMKKITAGPILKRFMQNMDTGIKRVYLYSADDSQIVAITKALDIVGVPEIPNYGTTLITEKLRGDDDQIYVRIVLLSSLNKKPTPLKLRNCGYECPMTKFKEIVDGLIPDDKDGRCTQNRKMKKKSA
ncbi:hypothetical protein QAD02_023759 [Eretmocerus hayati]|uniref:Uncharacterized protein n=1 Tax=Eretmocerus hayati TaxID=131215 RepID=A0ACC2PZ70_9HYME|nr:hypothetical protein QAD02_023759 [Eretmocerus hayati]